MNSGQFTVPGQYRILAILALLAVSNAQYVDFSFSSDFGNGKMLLDGDCAVDDNGLLRLSVNKSNLNQESGHYLTSRAVYGVPVQFYDAATGTAASFNTSFTLGVVMVVGTPMGDGLTFVIAPSSTVPTNSWGGSLGLYSLGVYGAVGNPGIQLVAVEFDTYQQDDWDAPSNHVGLDINSLESVKTQQLGPLGFPLNDTATLLQVGVYIEYDAAAQQLQVYLAHGPVASKSADALVLSYTDFNLSSYVRSKSYVGFTAATANFMEENYIYDWKFSTYQGLPREDVAQAPASPPSGSADLRGLGGGSSKNGALIWGVVGGVLGSLVVLGLGFWCCCICWRRWAGDGSGEERLTEWEPHGSYRPSRRKSRSSSGPVVVSSASSWDDLYAPQVKYGPRPFSYHELHGATRGFSPSEMLGSGGFGHVYRGLIRNPDGSEMTVAIKKITQDSKQGEREFRAEVLSIGRLRHKNLVHLLGWCHEQGQLLLVYEFMTNFSLDRHLYSEHAPLNWDFRFRILQGVATALVYIHTESPDRCILHRDLKPSNVMLDSRMTARLGDFGLARLIEDCTTDGGTAREVSLTQLAGTRGYLAPELVVVGKATTRTDIFSFGVLALEVASGRKPGVITHQNGQLGLVDWVWHMHESGKLMEVADPALEGGLNLGQLRRVLHIGLLCTLTEPRFRPSTKRVQQVLWEDLPLPPLPQSKPTPTYWMPSENGVDSGWRPEGL